MRVIKILIRIKNNTMIYKKEIIIKINVETNEKIKKSLKIKSWTGKRIQKYF